MTTYTEAHTIIPHGCTAEDLRDLVERIKDQGMPYTNRASRRRSRRVGDRARRASGRDAVQR
jgi:hypothetical protein